MASSKATYVCGIAGSDDGFVELESCRDHKGVDGIGGGHASFGQKHAGTLSDRSSEVGNRDAGVVQEAIDGGIEARFTLRTRRLGHVVTINALRFVRK